MKYILFLSGGILFGIAIANIFGHLLPPSTIQVDVHNNSGSKKSNFK